jgi:DNA-binding transcriptional ArsR family regulator
MDLSEPGRAFSGSLTMPILRALDGRSTPASAAQVARSAHLGTAAGIGRALERLSKHGLCNREELGGRALYSLNYEHVLYRAIRIALDADGTLVKNLKRALSSWDPEPIAGVLFGSAARRDGDSESDVDLLLVRPAMSSGHRERLWAPQVHQLRIDVQRWTGNHLQTIDWSTNSLRRYASRGEPLVDDLMKDGVLLTGSPVSDILRVHS